MKGMCRYGFLVVSVLTCHLSIAQLSDSLRFKRFGIEDGLPDAQVTGIVQDADGFLWISTTNGLSRYDGTEFRNFFYDRQKNALPGNNITNMVTYGPSHLVIATTTGLSLLNIHTLQFKNFLVNSRPVMFSRDNSFRHIVVDSFRNIWAGSRTALYCLSPELKILKVFRGYHETDYNKERMNYVGDIKLLPGNEIMVGLENTKTDSGDLFVYNYKTDSLQPLRTLTRHPYYLLSRFIAGNKYIDAKGNIHFVKYTSDSLSVFDPATQKLHFTRFSLQNTVFGQHNQAIHMVKAGDQSLVCVFEEGGFAMLPSSFSSNKSAIHLVRQFADKSINAIKTDKDGNLWIGSSNGLYKSIGISKNVHSILLDNNKQTVWNLWKIFFINDTVWVAAESSGFFKLTKQLALLDNIVLDKSPLFKIAWSVLQTNAKDTLWLNTQVGSRWYHQSTKTTGTLAIKGKPAAMDEKPITIAYKDSKGLTWMGIGFGNGVAQYNPSTRSFIHYPSREGSNRLPIRYPLAIEEDYETNLWMGNQDGAGLVRWIRKTNRFEIITPDYFSTFDNAFINALLCNRKEVLWIATNNGLFRFHIPTRRFIKYDVSHGLPSNAVTSITEDDKGRLWIGTSNGLSCFRPGENRFVNFMHPNTLPEPGISDVVYDSLSHKIFFTTNHYLNTFHPEQLLTESPLLSIKITGVAIDNEEQPVQSYYTIPHSRNDISFSFTAINLADGPLNKYYYRLKGQEWITVGAQRQINFLNLSPGDYSFSVRAVNNTGRWSNETTVHFTIRRPWWQTWWFLLASLIAVAGLISFLVKRRIRNIRHVAEMKQKIAETEMMALRAQMNPHFVFNCINSIDALIQSNDKYRATVYLNKFAKLLRNILDSSKQNTITLAKDLETLQLYIDLEQLRYENKFTASIRADESLLQDDYKVPPLIVQPYVENAIQHGLKNRPGNNGKLLVTVARHPEHIEFVIEDNGVGRNLLKSRMPKQNSSYGMQMSSDRVRFFNNESSASVVVTDLKEHGEAAGTKVQVILKMQ